jgi:hypothetical protein
MLFNPVGSQIGLFNVNLGTSSDPAVESQVLSDVASYGKRSAGSGTHWLSYSRISSL